jgi:hypothetical protein
LSQTYLSTLYFVQPQAGAVSIFMADKVYIPSPPDASEIFLKRGSYLLAVCALGRLLKGPRDRGAVMWVAASAYMYFLSKVWRYGFKQICAVFGLLGVDPLITRTDAYLEFGPVMGRGAMWVFAGEKAMRFIHKENMGLFNHEPGWPITFKEVLGYDAIFLQEDSKEHTKLRQQIVTAFSGDHFRDYCEKMQVINKGWLKLMDKNASKQSNTLHDFHESVTRLVFQLASALLIGESDEDIDWDASNHLADQYQVLSMGLMDPVGFIGLSMGLTTKSKLLLNNSAFGNAIKAKEFLISHIFKVNIN